MSLPEYATSVFRRLGGLDFVHEGLVVFLYQSKQNFPYRLSPLNKVSVLSALFPMTFLYPWQYVTVSMESICSTNNELTVSTIFFIQF